MRKVIIILALIFLFAPSISLAADFNNAYVRLNNQSANSKVSATVCTQPSSAGSATEAKVLVNFPSGFTISQSLSNWTTDTNNLPQGSTAWPGIGSTATSVSAKGVIFSSNDLTNNTLYCFNLDGVSSTTGAAGNDETGYIATQRSNGTTIDLTTYAVSVVSNNQINVSAKVDPPVSSLPISIESLDTDTTFSQNNVLSYKITYGSNSSTPIPLKVTAEWSRGTIEGSPTPSVDLLDYLIGSASNGYGATPPVIDTVNRTITWTINSIPANTTNQIVTFKLKTNSSYTGSELVDFKILARSNSGQNTTADEEVDQKYQYLSSNTNPTSTPTSAPSSNSNQSPTPTPTPAPIPLVFTNIQVSTISQSDATILVVLNKIANASIVYGQAPTNLSKSSALSTGQSKYLINIKDLLPDTDYYFRVKGSLNGSIVVSDIFTFRSAKESSPTNVDTEKIVITSNNNVVYDSNQTSKTAQSILIPQNNNFQFKFSINQNKIIKNIKIILRKKVSNKSKILGISTQNIPDSVDANSFAEEIAPGVYSAVINTNLDPGEYEIVAVVEDADGNITQQDLAPLKITNPFTVTAKDGKIIEGARVYLYILSSEKIYIPLSANFINIANPAFTNSKGIANFVLAKGKYKAIVSDLDYKDKTVFFTIGEDKNSTYPIVKMDPQPRDIFRLIRYYYRGFSEVFLTNTTQYADNLSDSIRFFDLVAFIIMLTLVTLTFFAFSKRHAIPLTQIHSYFYYLANRKKPNDSYVHGVVYGENDKPIPGVNVYLSDKTTEEIIGSTKTNANGEFYFKKTKGDYLLMATKVGFHPTPLLPYEDRENLKFKITLQKADFIHDSFDKLKAFIGDAFGMSFEILLLASLIFEFLFVNNFGVIKTLPFLLLSLFNLALWLMHLEHKRNFKV